MSELSSVECVHDIASLPDPYFKLWFFVPHSIAKGMRRSDNSPCACIR